MYQIEIVFIYRTPTQKLPSTNEKSPIFTQFLTTKIQTFFDDQKTKQKVPDFFSIKTSGQNTDYFFTKIKLLYLRFRKKMGINADIFAFKYPGTIQHFEFPLYTHH